MSFAISWEADEVQAGGFLYFDAVTSWNRSYTGQVTKHPVDGGSNVTDHFVKNNPVFTMSAVVSATDIAIASIALADEAGNIPSNVRGAPTGVQVSSSDDSLLMKFIPNVLGQFIPDKLPEVVMDGVPSTEEVGVEAGITEGLVTEPEPVINTRGIDSDYTESIQDILVSLQSGEGFNQITGQYQVNIRPVTLYETNNLLALIKKLPAANSFLVITSVNFREDTESGYALYADITFEQVSFATLKKTTLPTDVRATLKKKAAGKNSTGKADSTVKDAASANNTDPSNKKSSVIDSQNDVDPLRTTGG